MATPVRPSPKPIPKQGQVKVVKALYNYVAQKPDELSFEEGDILYILDVETEPNWWKAKCGEKLGVIPSNYVQENIEEIIHPLHEAARRGVLPLLREHLINNVSANGLDKAGCTALHWAAHAGYIECVNELLMVPNIEVNIQNRIGDTPLHSAAWRRHIDVVKALLDHGADPNITNKENKIPYDLANDVTVCSILKPFRQKCAMSSTSANIEDYGGSDDSD